MKFIRIALGSVVTILTKTESLWSLTLLIFQSNNNLNMETTIQITSQSYWIFQAISAIAIFVISYIVISRIQKNRERTNIFHWIYNYRFEIIDEYSSKKKGNNKIKFFNKDEFMFMLDKIGRKYPKKSREEKIKLLKPHYGNFLDEDSENYIELIDKSIK